MALRDNHPSFGNAEVMPGAWDSAGGLADVIALNPGARADRELFACARAIGAAMIDAKKKRTEAAKAAEKRFIGIPLLKL
jgi:hypothetical protein